MRCADSHRPRVGHSISIALLIERGTRSRFAFATGSFDSTTPASDTCTARSERFPTSSRRRTCCRRWPRELHESASFLLRVEDHVEFLREHCGLCSGLRNRRYLGTERSRHTVGRGELRNAQNVEVARFDGSTIRGGGRHVRVPVRAVGCCRATALGEPAEGADGDTSDLARVFRRIFDRRASRISGRSSSRSRSGGTGTIMADRRCSRSARKRPCRTRSSRSTFVAARKRAFVVSDFVWRCHPVVARLENSKQKPLHLQLQVLAISSRKIVPSPASATSPFRGSTPVATRSPMPKSSEAASSSGRRRVDDEERQRGAQARIVDGAGSSLFSHTRLTQDQRVPGVLRRELDRTRELLRRRGRAQHVV